MPKQTLSSNFSQSLKEWGNSKQVCETWGDILTKSAETENLYMHRQAPKMLGNSWLEIRPMIDVFARAYLVQELHSLCGKDFFNLGNLLQKLESPIEVMFFLALILIGRDEERYRIHCRWDEDNLPFDGRMNFTNEDESDILTIRPQHRFGEYRTDFFLEVESQLFDHETQRSATTTKTLIVECDGHEFHEKTKEQAQRDKKRDRTLQSLGHPVFRYTGSEMFKDCFRCAREVLSQLQDEQSAAPNEEQRDDPATS